MSWWMPVMKFVHLGAIAVWAAGLLVVPFMLMKRRRVPPGESVEEVLVFTRRMVLGLMAPAAVVAVASGTALILLRPVYVPWFTAKLAVVGVLAALHVVQSGWVLRMFAPDAREPRWRLMAAAFGNAVAIGAILLLVLAKPAWDWQDWPASWFSPGALGEHLGRWVQPWLDRVRG